MNKKLFISTISIIITLSIICSLSLSSINAASQAPKDNSIIEEFETATDWEPYSNDTMEAPTLSIDTHKKISGKGSLKISDNKKSNKAIAFQNKLFSEPLDLSNLNNIELNIYVKNVKQVSYLSFSFMTDYGNYYSAIVGQYQLMNGWNRIRRNITQLSKCGSPDLSKINRYYCYVEKSSDPDKNINPENKISINFDQLKFNVTGKTSIMLTFDDSWGGVYSKGAPVMNKYGMPGTLWASKNLSETDSQIMTTAQLDELYKLKWDVSNHTLTHPDKIDKLSKEERTKEYQENKNWILSNGWTRGADHVCYPNGQYDTELISLLKNNGIAKTGRTVISGEQASPVEDYFRLKCYFVGRDQTFDDIKKQIDNALLNHTDIFYMFHNIHDNPSSNSEEEIYAKTSVFIEMIEYLNKLKNECKLNVETVSEWYNQNKNLNDSNCDTEDKDDECYDGRHCCPGKKPSPSVSPTPTVSSSATVKPSATPTPTKEAEISPSPTIVLSPIPSNQATMPKAGETNPYTFPIVGILVLVIGAGTLFLIKKKTI